jgi:hypothetical protein
MTTPDDRFLRILAQNPELCLAVCGEWVDGNKDGPWFNLAADLACAESVEEINEIAREHWQIMFIDRPLKKGFVKLYG